MNPSAEPFSDVTRTPPVRGFIHRVERPGGRGLVLTHGAGSNCRTPLLVAMAEAFADAGITVLRCDLPFRQDRAFGPPRPGDAKHNREGLQNAIACLLGERVGDAFLGGHSYGGRQATMLCAEHPDLVSGLLLQSYPLHPPGRPEQLRVQHFPNLRLPALFVQGTRDPFGSIGEMESALKLIPAKTQLLIVEGAGHDLGFKGKSARKDLPSKVAAAFEALFAGD